MMKNTPMTQLEKLKALRAQRLAAQPTPAQVSAVKEVRKTLKAIRHERRVMKEASALAWQLYMSEPDPEKRAQLAAMWGFSR